MRLVSVTLQNYRIHQKITLEFDRERTVIGGPNESGKSTLVEAIHRGLFLRSKITGKDQVAMKSVQGGGHPEVTLTIEIGGKHYQLHKRFSGTSGTTALTVSAGSPLNGEAAEEELCRLLSVAADATTKASFGHWAHLWVLQGESGDDPSDHANSQRDSLLQRLSESGGASALLQSDTDARIAKYFADEVAATFTQRDKAKADSELARAEAEFNLGTSEHAAASGRLEKLAQALQDYTTATSTLEALKGELAVLKAEQEVADFKAARIAELQRQESSQAAEALTVETTLKELRKLDAQCGQLQKQIEAAKNSLAPREAEIARLMQAHEAAQEHEEASRRRYDLAIAEGSTARQRLELASAQRSLFKHRQLRDEWRARAAQAREVEASLVQLREGFAKLPAIEGVMLKQLEKLDREHADAEATLRAMAAGIEVIASDQAVSIGGARIAPGQPQIVTQETEITIGSGVRLRIRPGGGTSLADAQRGVQDTRMKLTKALDAAGVASLVEAHETFRAREKLRSRIEDANTRRADLDPTTLEEKLRQAEDEYIGLESTIARRAEALGQPAETLADESAARALQKQAEERFYEIEGEEKQALAQRNAAAKATVETAQLLTQQRSAAEKQKHELTEFDAQLRLLVETHGDTAQRSGRLTEVGQKKETIDRALSEVRKTLEREQPELLGPTQARLQRSRDDVQRRQAESAQKKAVAEHALRSDGTMDPEADLALAQAKRSAADDRLQSVRRRADAVRLLDELFREEQQVLADQYTQPLVEKADHYLRALYGRETSLKVNFTDGKFSGLRLTRPTVAAGSAVNFDQLSGGTKEQVAVAMRLAMAEVLAANHHGNLPLVLDDAFVNADPDRVQLLQRMLDLAATRGLQVIVVTCTPADYAALGAKHFQMPNVGKLLS